MKAFLIAAIAAVSTGSAAGIAVAEGMPATAAALLKSNSGDPAGAVKIVEAPHGVVMRIEAEGLTPGWHGLHFHEKGDCSKSDFTSAGSHVHMHATLTHGLLNPEANDSGDLPNLYAGADGKGVAEVFSPFVSLAGAHGRAALLDEDGSAVVIHASPDDHMSQPIGGAGARVACGVITGG